MDEIKSTKAIPEKRIAALQFEEKARTKFSEKFKVSLNQGIMQGIPKKFDFVSPDSDIVGDAKYFTLVKGNKLPAAKLSNISEYVWLLGKTGASHKFLVFGNDIEVPKRWLNRFRSLKGDIDFYFLPDDGDPELLKY